MIRSVLKLASMLFGEFEKEELKKFLRLGAIFAFILASFCALCPLKNSLFCTFVGPSAIPWVKTASLLILIPLIMIYTKLLDVLNRENVFYLLSSLYLITAVLFAAYYFFSTEQAVTSDLEIASAYQYYFTTFMNFAFYVWVESYGSLLVALFWAICTDITHPQSAQKGFFLVVTMGQLGGMIGAFFIAGLPAMLGHQTSTLALVIVCLTILISMQLLKNLFKKTPDRLLTSYHGSNEKEELAQQESGFLEGLYLLFRHKYLLGIFAVVAFPEIIMTMVDLHFNILASELYSGIELTRFHSYYTASVSLVTLLLLFCGGGRIATLFGLGVSLILMPLFYAGAMLGFISFSSLHFLFFILVASKALNYAVNSPAIKQLYIPTTHDVRFKSQAWIEVFGLRGSRGAGSLFGMLLGPFQNRFGHIAGKARHALFSSYLSLVLIGAWIFIALYLGKKHKTTLAEKKVVC